MRPHSMLAAFCMFVSSSFSGAKVATSGEFLAALSDTDMVPTVYETGELGPVDPDHRDTLSVITLPLDASHRPVAIEVSNSTYGPPGALDLSRDGRFAFVAETFRRRPDGATRLDQLAQGNSIRSLDLRDERPVVIDTVEIGTQPQAIQISPSGDLIVAITVDTDRELAFVPVRDGRFGAAVRFGLDLPPSSGFIPLKATWVQWHPSGRYIAVNLVDRAQVAFYEVIRSSDGSVSALRAWGNRVQTNKFPFVGRFSPDGRFYVTSDLQWGIDTKGFYGVQEGSSPRSASRRLARRATRHGIECLTSRSAPGPRKRSYSVLTAASS